MTRSNRVSRSRRLANRTFARAARGPESVPRVERASAARRGVNEAYRNNVRACVERDQFYSTNRT
eukprot:1677389-Lingulodinium_polyedra.AAC.1